LKNGSVQDDALRTPTPANVLTLPIIFFGLQMLNWIQPMLSTAADTKWMPARKRASAQSLVAK
jgi:hypothetical protein